MGAQALKVHPCVAVRTDGWECWIQLLPLLPSHPPRARPLLHACSAIVKQLLEKHAGKVHITVFDAACKPGPHLVPGVTYIRGDIVAYVHVRNALEGMHCVVHTAGLIGGVTTFAKAIEDVNLKGTQNVVEACLELDICVLVYSSSSEGCHCLRHGPMQHAQGGPLQPPASPVFR